MVWTYGWLVAHHVQETAASALADAQEKQPIRLVLIRSYTIVDYYCWLIWCEIKILFWLEIYDRLRPIEHAEGGLSPYSSFPRSPSWGVLVPRNDLARMPGIDLNPRLSQSNARESCLAQATFCNKLWTKNRPIHAYYQLKQHIPTVRSPHTQRNEWSLELHMWELKRLTPGSKHMHQCLQCIAPILSKRSIHTLVSSWSLQMTLYCLWTSPLYLRGGRVNMIDLKSHQNQSPLKF